MSTADPTTPRSPSDPRGTAARARARAQADEVSGWTMFAGVMLAILGIVNFIYGIAAVDGANFYAADTRFVISGLNTWGWVMLGIGVIQFSAACSLFVGGTWGRWVGILSAGGNAIAQLMWIQSYPWLSVSLFALDVLVLYGLIAHTGRRQTV